MLDLVRLNDHSRQFATRLFRAWPDWYRHSRYDPYEDFEKEALLVEVPRPCDSVGHGLFVTTSEWEIAIGFGECFHTRFGAGGEKSTGNFYDQAMAFLEAFVAEKIVVAVAREGQQWLGAWQIDLTVDSLDDVELGPGESVMIYSWLGTHDCEITGA